LIGWIADFLSNRLIAKRHLQDNLFSAAASRRYLLETP